VPTHYHAGHFEAFILLSGEDEWTMNGETHRMRTGDAVNIHANAPRSARTLGSEPANFKLMYYAVDNEAHLEREVSKTEEQRNDPVVNAVLKKLNDFVPS